MDNYGNLIKNVLDGCEEELIKNSPITSLKTEDFGLIIMETIDKAKGTDKSSMEIYHEAITKANELRVS